VVFAFHARDQPLIPDGNHPSGGFENPLDAKLIAIAVVIFMTGSRDTR
jgi:hypothetical protein